MKARQTIYVKKVVTVEGAEDDFGVKKKTTSTDLAPIKVFSIAHTQDTETHSLVSGKLLIASPSDYGLTSSDVLVIGGKEWAVEGDPIDCTRGPFGYKPGWIINAERTHDG